MMNISCVVDFIFSLGVTSVVKPSLISTRALLAVALIRPVLSLSRSLWLSVGSFTVSVVVQRRLVATLSCVIDEQRQRRSHRRRLRRCAA